MTRQSFQSPLARALGRGAANSGVQHWWADRVAAVALVPLCLWFAASIIAHAGSDYAGFIAWFRTPFATSCMILPLIALFHHSALGPQVVIEDYISKTVPNLQSPELRREMGHSEKNEPSRAINGPEFK